MPDPEHPHDPPVWIELVWKSLLGLASVAVIGLASFVLATKDETAAGLREITMLNGSVTRIEDKMEVITSILIAQLKTDLQRLEARLSKVEAGAESHARIDGHLVMRKEFEAHKENVTRLWEAIRKLEGR